MLREEFVKLYSRDNSSSFNLLNSLRNEMIDKYGDNIVPVSKHCEDRLRRVSKTGSWFPFDKNDWRPIEIPKLPFKDDDDICTSRLLNISRVSRQQVFLPLSLMILLYCSYSRMQSVHSTLFSSKDYYYYYVS